MEETYEREKKTIATLVMVLFVLSISSCFAESEWYKSDDGMLEVKFISFEETSYPQYAAKVQFRLDGNKESNLWEAPFNLSSTISQYTFTHPEMKNRKLSVACGGSIESFTLSMGTSYDIILPVTIAEEQETDLIITIDAATVFPNDFVNADAMTAAMMLREVRDGLVDPSSFVLREAEVKDTRFAFVISANNKLGGTITAHFVGKFYPESSEYWLNYIESDTTYGISVPYMDMMNDISSYLLNNYHLSNSTSLSVQTIMNYMN